MVIYLFFKCPELNNTGSFLTIYFNKYKLYDDTIIPMTEFKSLNGIGKETKWCALTNRTYSH